MTDVNSTLIEHLRQRAAFGANKYGVELTAFNGRNPLKDKREELLDALVYNEQDLMEREEIIALLYETAAVIESGMVSAQILDYGGRCFLMAQKLQQDIKRIEPEDIVLGEDVTDQFTKRKWTPEEIAELQGKWKSEEAE